MGDLAFTETASVGAKLLEDWLKENGYTNIEIDSWPPDSIDIMANGQVENILVYVKTALLPAERPTINGTDRFALKDTATRLNRIPYTALLIIDENKKLVGEIMWERVL